MSVHETTVDTPRGRFGVRTTEPPASAALLAPVVCLHGFPDDASSFDAVGRRLAARGHPVTSVYLRGYAPSPLTGPYSTADLSQDLLAVVAAVGGGTAVNLIAHDFGAQIAFASLGADPSSFRSAVLLSGAHPDAIARNTRRHPTQLWASRYIVFFQLGGFADRRVARDEFAFVDRLWARWSPRPLPADHRAHVKATLRRSMPAPVAMYRGGGFAVASAPIRVPVLFVAGAADRCILPAMSEGQERYVAAPYERQVWPGVGHFPQLEDPERTAGAAITWFAAH